MTFMSPESKRKSIVIYPARREAEGSGWQVANQNN